MMRRKVLTIFSPRFYRRAVTGCRHGSSVKGKEYLNVSHQYISKPVKLGRLHLFGIARELLRSDQTVRFIEKRESRHHVNG
jgi:hypothetical protein